jgi:hypothetical protein
MTWYFLSEVPCVVAGWPSFVAVSPSRPVRVYGDKNAFFHIYTIGEEFGISVG